MRTNKLKNYSIDATGKSLGRLASEVATYLQGKNSPAFVRNIDMGDVVRITNIKKAKFTGKKIEQKIYYKHSGYPGGLKGKPLNDLWLKNPAEVFRQVVWGMLPKNTLRKSQIERLIVE